MCWVLLNYLHHECRTNTRHNTIQRSTSMQCTLRYMHLVDNSFMCDCSCLLFGANEYQPSTHADDFIFIIPFFPTYVFIIIRLCFCTCLSPSLVHGSFHQLIYFHCLPFGSYLIISFTPYIFTCFPLHLFNFFWTVSHPLQLPNALFPHIMDGLLWNGKLKRTIYEYMMCVKHMFAVMRMIVVIILREKMVYAR